MARFTVALWPAESSTRTVNGALPAAVGVPETVPLLVAVTPPGSEPRLMLHE